MLTDKLQFKQLQKKTCKSSGFNRIRTSASNHWAAEPHLVSKANLSGAFICLKIICQQIYWQHFGEWSKLFKINLCFERLVHVQTSQRSPACDPTQICSCNYQLSSLFLNQSKTEVQSPEKNLILMVNYSMDPAILAGRFGWLFLQ